MRDRRRQQHGDERRLLVGRAPGVLHPAHQPEDQRRERQQAGEDAGAVDAEVAGAERVGEPGEGQRAARRSRRRPAPARRRRGRVAAEQRRAAAAPARARSRPSSGTPSAIRAQAPMSAAASAASGGTETVHERHRLVSSAPWPRDLKDSRPVLVPQPHRGAARREPRPARPPRSGALRRADAATAWSSRSASYAHELGLETRFFQTNFEGAFVEHLHRLDGIADGIVLNPGAWTHYSWAIRDALEIAAPAGGRGAPQRRAGAREEFRRVSVIGDLCVATVSGQGAEGYRPALERLRGASWGADVS